MIAIVIFLYIVLYGFAIYRFKYALFFFVTTIPLSALISINFVPLNQYLAYILLFHFISNGAFSNFFSNRKKKRLNNAPFMWFLFAAILFGFINSLQNGVLQEGEIVSLPSQILALARKMVYFINVVIVVNVLYDNKQYREIVFKGAVASGLVIAVSMFFSYPMADMGFNVRITSKSRSAGLFNGGDGNGATSVLNMILFFVFIYRYYTSQRLSTFDIITVLLLAAGVASTQSRMGFITLIVVLAYSVLRVRNRKMSGGISALIIVGAFVIVAIPSVLSGVLGRINEFGVMEEVTESDDNGRRVGLWMDYIDYMMHADTHTILFGSKVAVTGGLSHNFFVETFFINGLFGIIIFLFLFVRSIILGLSRKNTIRTYIIVFMIIFVSFMFLNSYTVAFYYAMISSMLPYLNEEKYMSYANPIN